MHGDKAFRDVIPLLGRNKITRMRELSLRCYIFSKTPSNHILSLISFLPEIPISSARASSTQGKTERKPNYSLLRLTPNPTFRFSLNRTWRRYQDHGFLLKFSPFSSFLHGVFFCYKQEAFIFLFSLPFFFLVNFSVGIDDGWDVWRLQGMDCCVIMLELVI